tara:strand:- start:313 stop:483 length:171 start_codon:yes stop_codon:yes gene_type:complete
MCLHRKSAAGMQKEKHAWRCLSGLTTAAIPTKASGRIQGRRARPPCAIARIAGKWR